MSSIGNLFSLLSLKAFIPDPADADYTMRSRLAKVRSVLVLTMGGAGVQGFRARLRGGGWKIEKGDGLEGPYLTPAILEHGRDIAQSNWVVLSFTPANLLCEMENGRLPDDAALQKALLNNPKSILRNRYEQDRRYQIIASGDRRKYISFSVTTREITVLEKMIKDAGMEIARIQIGLANMTELAIRRLEEARKDGTKRVVLAGDQSIILSTSIRNGVWEDPFSFISRTSVGGPADPNSVVEYLESLAAEIDEPGAEFHAIYSQPCWWIETVEQWFAERASRYTLVKMEVPEYLPIHLAMEG